MKKAGNWFKGSGCLCFIDVVIMWIIGGVLENFWIFFVTSIPIFTMAIVQLVVGNSLCSDSEDLENAMIQIKKLQKELKAIKGANPSITKNIKKAENDHFKNMKDNEYIEMCCPSCNEKLSFMKSEIEKGEGVCPFCDAEIKF